MLHMFLFFGIAQSGWLFFICTNLSQEFPFLWVVAYETVCFPKMGMFREHTGGSPLYPWGPVELSVVFQCDPSEVINF